jgi:tetratricopeptide (TPR) repeat protein
MKKKYLFLFWCLLLMAKISAQTDQAKKLYEKAILLLEKEKNDEALENLNKAIGLSPAYYDALFARGFYFQEIGESKKAAQDYALLTTLYPSKIAPFLGLGEIFWEDEQYEKAENYLLDAYQIDSTDIDVLNNLGAFYYTLDLNNDALYYLNQSLIQKKENDFALFYRAKTYLAIQKNDLAEADVNALLKINPKDSDTKKLQMELFLAQKKYEEVVKIAEELKKADVSFTYDDFLIAGKALIAQKKFKEALDYLEVPYKPNDYAIYHYRAKAKFWLQEYKEAINDLDSALILVGNDNIEQDEILYDRSVALFKNSRIKDAEKNYLQALYITPEMKNYTTKEVQEKMLLGEASKILLTNKEDKPKIDSVCVKAFLERAETYLADDMFPEAMLQTHEAMNLDSLNSMVFTLRGMARAMQRDDEKAWKDLEKAEKLTKNQDIAKIFYAKGVLLREQEKLKESKIYFEKATQKKPQIDEYWAELANICFMLQDFNAALQNIEKAILLDKEYPEYYLDRAIYQRNLKNLEKSLEDCNKALALENDNPFAFKERGLTFYEMKKYNEAAQDFEVVLNTFPDDEQTQKLLEECLDKKKNK